MPDVVFIPERERRRKRKRQLLAQQRLRLTRRQPAERDAGNVDPWENFLMIRLARIKRVPNERQSRRRAAGNQNERRSQQSHF